MVRWPLTSRDPERSSRDPNTHIVSNRPIVKTSGDHTHTVVWECCKDDRRSQLGNGKIWPSADAKPLNRSSPNLKHVIMSRIPSSKKILGLNPPREFCPPYTRNIHPNSSNVYCTFFIQFFRRPTDALVGPIFTLNTSFDVDLRKVVPFGG